ncbi:diacylglycerol kinase [Amylibacter marinus]|uniref:Diacylglycerol kinase n=1 Tax=Amylibacter marinus TaxID=1475483 RepID=A0ABQ5VWX4_9RHOB|nr:cytochrome c [Amylibacter marinus]GLQ35850.1 diacylglycerol kinase [Amylibacter marinus]
MRKFAKSLLIFVVLSVLAAWVLTAPKFLDPAPFDQATPNLENGALVFAASGCSSCHAAHKAKGNDKMILSGGIHFETAFGTFIAPNISPSDEGIGGWSVMDLANAMQRGVSPDGAHYYPAFPYTSYTRMSPQDIVDLHSYLQNLPKSSVPSAPHQVGFPFNIRRAMGGWKLLFMRDGFVAEIPDDPILARGQYLVEGAGHCAECHTPRNPLGGLLMGKWLAGGQNPDGPGRIPNITPHALTWSAEEIAEYLATGFTPEFDVVGGSMVSVQENMALLPASDRTAIAAYLLHIDAISGD